MKRRWERSHFDSAEEEPLGPLANLVDLMLVFVCGLVAALVAISPELERQLREPQELRQGRELPQVPDGIRGQGDGYETLGKVYRDPETGKLILIAE